MLRATHLCVGHVIEYLAGIVGVRRKANQWERRVKRRLGEGGAERVSRVNARRNANAHFVLVPAQTREVGQHTEFSQRDEPVGEAVEGADAAVRGNVGRSGRHTTNTCARERHSDGRCIAVQQEIQLLERGRQRGELHQDNALAARRDEVGAAVGHDGEIVGRLEDETG